MEKIEGNRWTVFNNELRASFIDWSVEISLGICFGQSSWLLCFYEGKDMSKAFRCFNRNSLEECLSLLERLSKFKTFSELKKALDEISNN